MKHLLKTIGLLSAFISACSSYEPRPYPVETEINVVPKTTINDVFVKSDNRNFTELKTENFDRPNKDVVYVFSLILLIVFGYFNYTNYRIRKTKTISDIQ